MEAWKQNEQNSWKIVAIMYRVWPHLRVFRRPIDSQVSEDCVTNAVILPDRHTFILAEISAVFAVSGVNDKKNSVR